MYLLVLGKVNDAHRQQATTEVATHFGRTVELIIPSANKWADAELGDPQPAHRVLERLAGTGLQNIVGILMDEPTWYGSRLLSQADGYLRTDMLRYVVRGDNQLEIV